MRQIWTVRLGRQAEQDYVEILQWTTKIFGKQQANTYAETMARAIEALEDGPDVLGVRVRDDIQPGIRTLHVARQGFAGRHFVVFRVTGSDIDILRLLHDSMDLPRHLPADE
jgi:toxin ParE1/3/4